jgi:hypothetical protein
MKLVLVHGRAQGRKDPAALRQEWMDALDQGLARAGLTPSSGLEVAFPYYGDTLDELVREVDADLLENVVAKGGGEDQQEADFRGEFLYELATAAGITDAEIVAQHPTGVVEKGPQNWEWVHSILKALDRTPLGTPAIDAFTRDVYVYLSYPGVRRRIDEIVAEHVSGPCVVLGHSLGSVVAYNVLRATPESEDVKRYVTVGSPLGVRAIQKKLDTPLTMPACTNAWYNAMDERDVVALRPLDAATFPIHPAIVNKTDVDNFTPNRHGIAGYLSDADVARAVWEAVEG